MSGHAHVAIDGPAGSGKTTVARALARRLGVLYLDTGAMYRAVALCALRAGIDPGEEAAVVDAITQRPVRVTLDPSEPDGFRVWSADVPFGNELYDNSVSRVVSLVAAHPRVRTAMVERQRSIAAENAVVMAGRDIGTVVLPDAPFKIYLTASVDERARRRSAELSERGASVEREELKAEIERRDLLDSTREASPLRAAADAIEIDSTGQTVEAVVERIAALVRARA